MQDDMLLQLRNQTMSKANLTAASNANQTAASPAAEIQANHTISLREEYAKCLVDSQCPCRGEAKVGKALQLMDKKKKTKCAVGMGSCSEKCSAKVIDEDILTLSNQAQKVVVEQSDSEAKRSLLQKRKGFPLHPIKI